MQSHTALLDFAGRLQRFIQIRPLALHDHQFGELALQLFSLQRESNEPYRKICQARGISTETNLPDWPQIPAVPTSAFKDLQLSCLSAHDRSTVFHSSGTTQQRPSRHFHNSESLHLYEASLLAAIRQRLDVSDRYTIVSLTPPREFAPHSSLVYMFESFRQKFGDDDSRFVGAFERNGGWTVNVDIARDTFLHASESESPVLILGTAFLYVHLLDFLKKNDLRIKLPPGSHVLETGGYKGRSRIIPKDELHQQICERFGISPSEILCEYGMSELSSQAYSLSLINSPHCRSRPKEAHILSSRKDQSLSPDAGSAPAITFHFPPWVRVQIISPETGREVKDGETGLIRIFDLANVFSVMAIQTEDLAIRRGDGFDLIGRAEAAEPRGCSLMAV